MGEANQPTTPAELAALSAIVQALTPLPREAHARVIDAALVLLGGRGRTSSEAQPPAGRRAPESPAEMPTDVRRFKDQKQPKSASEMAALVAYYLSEVAQPAERKDAVDTADMIKYFKQAGFQLPGNPKMTLVHAKNAGYFDAVGNGQYRLNPVGYNLVAHSLPRESGQSTARRSTKRARPRAKRR